LNESFPYPRTKRSKVPIIISIPHCGTEFPDELKDDYLPQQVGSLDDTDWFLQDLNDFASSMGITVVYAKYSRWVIDLNRDPQSAPLYNDGRLITGLTTTLTLLEIQFTIPEKNLIKQKLNAG
jgi:N-formylglutamate deformylase